MILCAPPRLRSFPINVRLIDPSSRDTRSPISTNQRRGILLFLARILFHTLVTQAAHTDSVQFCCFWFNRPSTAKWYKVIDLQQFPVGISKNEAPTPLQTVGIFIFPVFQFPFFFFFSISVTLHFCFFP